jgi:hypothetical protein
MANLHQSILQLLSAGYRALSKDSKWTFPKEILKLLFNPTKIKGEEAL